MAEPETLRVHIPLTLRNRDGRPRILPPKEIEVAREEGISDRYVSRVIRLAWLSPLVPERLVLRREPTVLSIFDLCCVAELPWGKQPERVFD